MKKEKVYKDSISFKLWLFLLFTRNLKKFRKNNYNYNKIFNLHHKTRTRLSNAFLWKESPEGLEYWREVDKQFQNFW